MTELAQGPWQDISIDLMGPLLSGDYVFAATDYYSRYVEINISKRNTAEVAISSLENMFATHGLPVTVTSDNGPHLLQSRLRYSYKRTVLNTGKQHHCDPKLLLKRMQIAQLEGQDWKKDKKGKTTREKRKRHLHRCNNL